MGETGNIEKMAKLVSQDIFNWFKWKTCDLKDSNWTCVSEQHKKKTHPADVVFYYDDPYTGKVVYLNTDLKSYSKGSITTSSISTALRSLSIATECANISEDWQSKYLVEPIDFGVVIGLLFLFNHDNKFDKDLSETIEAINFKKIIIPDNVTLAFLDPDKIRTLLNVVNDLKGFIAEVSLTRDDYTFFYPDLLLSKRHGEEWGQPASIESLTAPWLIIKHKSTQETEEGFLIYYHMRGETVEEFIYFIDALSHYQLLISSKPIRMKFTDSCEEAFVNFSKAKHEYLKAWGSDEAREKQLNRIEARNITNVITGYSPVEIGMRDDAE